MIIKTDQETIKGYFEDASGLTGAHADKVFLPESYDEVSAILREADLKKIPVTISGGGTGVTGGRLAFGGILIAMDGLNKIISADKDKMIVQAGVLITDIHNKAASLNCFYPPDATEWNAMIGGNIATNASGSRTFKYGATREYVKSIKVVLANGEMLDIPRGKYLAKGNSFEIPNPKSQTNSKFKIPNYKMPEIKNAAGYYSKENMDLIDLFIGSEGTLGVVVEAELRLLPVKGYTFACFAFFDEENKAIDFVEEVKRVSKHNRAASNKKGLDALAVEFFDHNSIKLLRTKYPILPKNAEAAIFFEEEITESRKEFYLEDWNALLEKHGVSSDKVWVAEGSKKEQEFKDIRHDLPELVNEIVKARGFPKAGTDIAVPDEKFRNMFKIYREILTSSNMDNLIFGHIGDSHLHVNMLPRSKEELENVKEIYLYLVRTALAFGGTVSAEHGIGKLKHRFLLEMYGKHGIDEMIRVKKYFDPNLILGRGNIFPQNRSAVIASPAFGGINSAKQSHFQI